MPERNSKGAVRARSDEEAERTARIAEEQSEKCGGGWEISKRAPRKLHESGDRRGAKRSNCLFNRVGCERELT